MKKIIVLSLGGSLIIPDEIDLRFLQEFKKVILKNSGRYKFVIVCGGGSIARRYISALKESGISEKLQSMIGISATRTNARFMTYFFNKDQTHGVPEKMSTIENYVKNSDIVFCGGLEYKPNQTSDATAAQIAQHFNSNFINLTDVQGLHDKNPKKFKDAKFIPEISWQDFNKMAHTKKYQPGQHFVLDQAAAEIIQQHKIITYILGKDMKQLDNLLNGRKFKGTTIQE